MKHLPRITWLLIAFILLALSACGKGGSATPANTDLALTQIASTAYAMETQTAQALPTATYTPQATSIPESTNTTQPIETPNSSTPSATQLTGTPNSSTPSATPLVLNTPKATSQSSCDNMEGIDDITYPDGTVVEAGKVMDKTWSVKNLGPCTWTKDYAIAFAYGGDGTDWKNAKPGHLSGAVKPGVITEVTITLKAPTVKGTYGAYFRMMNDKGFFFGKVVWITIKVE